jgi:hypothetical protein
MAAVPKDFSGRVYALVQNGAPLSEIQDAVIASGILVHIAKRSARKFGGSTPVEDVAQELAIILPAVLSAWKSDDSNAEEFMRWFRYTMSVRVERLLPAETTMMSGGAWAARRLRKVEAILSQMQMEGETPTVDGILARYNGSLTAHQIERRASNMLTATELASLRSLRSLHIDSFVVEPTPAPSGEDALDAEQVDRLYRTCTNMTPLHRAVFALEHGVDVLPAGTPSKFRRDVLQIQLAHAQSLEAQIMEREDKVLRTFAKRNPQIVPSHAAFVLRSQTAVYAALRGDTDLRFGRKGSDQFNEFAGLERAARVAAVRRSDLDRRQVSIWERRRKDAKGRPIVPKPHPQDELNGGVRYIARTLGVSPSLVPLLLTEATESFKATAEGVYGRKKMLG